MISRLLRPWAGPSCHVLAGAGVAADAREGDGVQGGVGLAVATAVESMPAGLARGGRERVDSAKGGEAGLVPHPFGIAACCDEQGGCDVGADAELLEQGRGRGCGDRGDCGPELVDLVVEVLPPAGGGTQPQLARFSWLVSRCGGALSRAAGHLLPKGALVEVGTEVLGCGDQQRAEEIRGLGAGLDRRASGCAQLAQSFARGIGRLRHPKGLLGQHRAGGHLRVDRVGLPMLTTDPTPGTGCFVDGLAGCLQAAGQPVPFTCEHVVVFSVRSDMIYSHWTPRPRADPSRTGSPVPTVESRSPRVMCLR